MSKAKQKVEYGDWQTPIALAEEVCSLLSSQGLKPASVIEPTLGKGTFLIAALKFFPTLTHAVGVEINQSYVKLAEEAVSKTKASCKVDLIRANFFDVDWIKIIKQLPEPILIIGNPPWVTNAELTTLGSANLPRKSNFQNFRGIDALTGKSNFDISEWMLLQALPWMENREVTLAMLCKTVVARKFLLKAWQGDRSIKTSSIYHIDTSTHFGASVDACLLIVPSSSCVKNTNCRIYDSLSQKKPSNIIGYKQNRLVSNVEVFEQHKHLLNDKNHREYIWRSGIKHDCANIMELKEEEKGFYRNGLGEISEMEEDFLYPMLKSSDVAKGPPFDFSKKLLVTQHHVSENTSYIRHTAPKTWNYLNKHAAMLNSRASSIYRNRPKFSIFGVGDYSFAPHKVAISGFYKFLNFNTISSFNGKPVVLDDTCYFIGCENEDEAVCLAEILNSQTAKEFFSSLIFWDAKRPITMDLLCSLSINSLAQQLGLYTKLHNHSTSLQLSFFE
jgi:hypothetical protein